MNNQKLLQLVTDAGANIASDLHLMAGARPAFRVNGAIVFAEDNPLSVEEVTTMAFSLLNPAQRERWERDWGVAVGFTHPIAGRIRATVYRRDGHPELSVRLCGDHVPPRAELGLPEKVDEFVARPGGLILIAGPSGSGRTTTFNYLLDRLNRSRHCRIITIEDPVEYVHPGIGSSVLQQEVHTDTRSMAAGAAHALRQDAEVIGLGLIGDADTAAAAVQAAETGHLVLGTIAAAGAVSALERLAAWLEEPRRECRLRALARGLVGVLGQRLLPAAGTARRVLACEVLPAGASVRELVRAGAWPQLEADFQAGRLEQAETLDDALNRLQGAGAISPETAQAHARVPGRVPRRQE
ncbi:MAG: type IV pilus twitching motility protein PilT [Limisphaerales bacterium]